MVLTLVVWSCNGTTPVNGEQEEEEEDGENEVTFPDSDLEAVIREAINKPEGAILVSDLEGLISLYAYVRNITDLTSLEYCTSLTQLNLQLNQIGDISPLASLVNLTELWLNSNPISDISPLASLTNLMFLQLMFNQISDISPLVSLTNLTHLVYRTCCFVLVADIT